MKVVVKKKAIKQIISEFLEAKAAPAVVNEPALPPIHPDEKMQTQVAHPVPEVEKGDFSPSSTQELHASMTALFADVPDDELKKIYRKVKRIAKKSAAKSATGEEIKQEARKRNHHPRGYGTGPGMRVGPFLPSGDPNPDWTPARWDKFRLGKRNLEDSPERDASSHRAGDWGDASDEELAAIEAGEEGAGDFKADEPEIDPEIEETPATVDAAESALEQLDGGTLEDIELTPDQVRRMTMGDLIKVIATKIGTGLNNVRNIIYDDLQLLGGQPKRGRKMPSKYDMEKWGTAHNIEAVIYGLFRELMQAGNPDVMEAYPAGKSGLGTLKDRGMADPHYLFFKYFAQIFLKTVYGNDIKDARYLVANWHTIGTKAQIGTGRPHSEDNPLQLHILNDIIDEFDKIDDKQLKNMLKKASDKAHKQSQKSA